MKMNHRVNKGPHRMHLLSLILLVVLCTSAAAITGDLNRDGRVDFDDFFLLADNFGRTGPPETIYDTVHVTIYDTIYVALPETEKPPPGDAHGGEMVNVWDYGFFMDKYEVTNAQYAEFILATGHRQPESADWGKEFWNTWEDDAPPTGFENHPVVGVNWEDANAYCEWAGKRLPTSEEWILACQGTDGRDHPWGIDFPNEGLANYGRNVGRTTAVGSYPNGASKYGAMDMAGNVLEWTTTPWKEDPEGRVLHGLSWAFNIGSSQSSCTSPVWNFPGYRASHYGFRCVRSAQ